MPVPRRKRPSQQSDLPPRPPKNDSAADGNCSSIASSYAAASRNSRVPPPHATLRLTVSGKASDQKVSNERLLIILRLAFVLGSVPGGTF
jgi:hypothetical protein